MKRYRIERDSLGDVEVPAAALWGAQTQRAIDNFAISRPLPNAFIRAVAQIKQVAAMVNNDLGLLEAPRAEAICAAAQRLIDGECIEQFPVDVFQTGSGTSTNMNVNEVIARLCQQSGVTVGSNDDVNLGQSSNDTIPTAIHLATALNFQQQLLPALMALQQQLAEVEAKWPQVIKPGRTHLMDAMPITLGQQLRGWRAQLEYLQHGIEQAQTDLLAIPQGGTAVGTGINCHAEFAERFSAVLAQQTGLAFHPISSPFAAQGAIDRPLAASAALRALAVVLMKISNDLRWMNSGPLHGLAEIRLPALQPGSSIMPGKVNPVICEALCMVCAQVIGLDHANALAAQSGNFELNVMLPLVADNLLTMGDLLARGITHLSEKALAGMTVNDIALAASMNKNPVLVTALNPLIGYDRAAAIAKQAYASGRPVIDVALEQTDLSREVLEKYLDPVRLTRGGFTDEPDPKD